MKHPGDGCNDGDDEGPAYDVASDVAAAAFVQDLVVYAAVVFEDDGLAAFPGDLHLACRLPCRGVFEHAGHARCAQRGIGAHAFARRMCERFHELRELLLVARRIGDNGDVPPVRTRGGLFAIGREAEHIAKRPSFRVIDGKRMRIGGVQISDEVAVGVFEPCLLAFLLVELPDDFAAIADRVIRSGESGARAFVGGLKTDIRAVIDIGCVCGHVLPFVIG